MSGTNYYENIWKSMTTRHYERGGWYSLDGHRMTLEQALDYRGDCAIHYSDEPIVRRGPMQYCMKKLYPPSLWAHGGKRVF